MLDAKTLPRKANLGCGYDIRPGYLNVDLYERHGPDLVADVTDLPMLPSGHFEEIIAQDVLEHLERHKTVPTLQEWSRLLAPEGVIHIRVPSLFDLFEMLASPDWRSIERTEEVIHLLYGTQAYTGDYHLAGFTPAILVEYLQRAGLQLCRGSLLHGWLYEVSARKTNQLSDPEEIVHNAYFRVLQRPADEGGLNHLSLQLKQGRMTANAVEEALRQSDEGRFLETHPYYLRRYMHSIQNEKPSPASQDVVTRIKSRIGRFI
ncbi:methyltransferase domain-containing protein [Chelativorans sp. J32]|uniref:class I SAM-dependent methyltransferase n=1 Tax=Chelativorans sp. J32 TaxID=935840 RepID=UPI0004BBFD93|nr:methyltransferase domain-containing protein [Chelativorans sp. J32]